MCFAISFVLCNYKCSLFSIRHLPTAVKLLEDNSRLFSTVSLFSIYSLSAPLSRPFTCREGNRFQMSNCWVRSAFLFSSANGNKITVLQNVVPGNGRRIRIDHPPQSAVASNDHPRSMTVAAFSVAAANAILDEEKHCSCGQACIAEIRALCWVVIGTHNEICKGNYPGITQTFLIATDPWLSICSGLTREVEARFRLRHKPANQAVHYFGVDTSVVALTWGHR